MPAKLDRRCMEKLINYIGWARDWALDEHLCVDHKNRLACDVQARARERARRLFDELLRECAE
jgi:hypothetical protein